MKAKLASDDGKVRYGKLLCGTRNLLKLWRHTSRQPAPTPLAT